MTPSSPAPSNSSNQRCAISGSPVAGVTWIGGCAPARASLERAAALPEGLTGEVVVAEGEQVEGDEVRRGALRKELDAALGRMDALLQGLEVEAPA